MGISTLPGQKAAERPDARAARARWAAPVPFLILGLVFSSYFVQIPSLKSDLGLTEGELGAFLVLPVLSGVVAMQWAGRLVARQGSATLVRLTMLGLPLSLLGFAVCGDRVTFAVVLVVFGAVDGLMDISINAHAVAVERALQRRVMNSCHAAWSIGAALGSGLGAAAHHAELSRAAHLTLIAAAQMPLALAAGRHLLPAAADREADQRPRATGWRTGWTPRLLLLGLTGTVVLITGGVVGNWGGIYLHEDLGASLATASLGYLGFSAFEAGVRLVGDGLQERLGTRRLTGASAAVAVTGLTAVVLSPSPAAAIAGFSLLGLGMAVLVPITLGAAGHGEGEHSAADALAKVGTLTYTGMLLGPVFIGWCAGSFGLTATLAGLLVLLSATLLVGLRRL
ncbi:MFS transporter [Streptomyces sp. 7-21]|uniref:MFS transporter n=1 Tax=Streptomyces sp. 7-21 TaxID=2802283 RepID=UPI00191E2A13|nr:MFS transporter [Streptomyces sp. 7-21]MBL1067471.1 MFS transporter [Streptomyces sp. 7-21]